MAWQTVASIDTRYGYTKLQYDDASTGNSRTSRVIFELKGSSYNIDVYFKNFTVDGSNKGAISVNGNMTLWQGTLAAGERSVSYTCQWFDIGKVDYSGKGTIPAGLVAHWLNVSVMAGGSEHTDGSVGRFDLYKNGNLIASQVSDQPNNGYYPGETYKVDHITESSSDWYYDGPANYTGTFGNSDMAVQIPFKAVVAPTGKAELTGRKWNSITAKATISSFGAPVRRAYPEVGVLDGSATSYSQRWNFANDQSNLTNPPSTVSYTFTGGRICGCYAFKVGWYAVNGKKSSSGVNNTVYYLPPHDMAEIKSVKFTRNDSNVTQTVSITGAPADGTSNVVGALVNTEYRYSFDGGATYTDWKTGATGRNPASPVTIDIVIPYNKTLKVQARQAVSQDTTQKTAVKSVDIEAVHPYPSKPKLSVSWDELKRTMTVTIRNTNFGGAAGDASLKEYTVNVGYGSASTPFYTKKFTKDPASFSLSYMRPGKDISIAATVTNNFGLTSDADEIDTIVLYPIWGIVNDGKKIQLRVRDIRMVQTDGSMTRPNWIEGASLGKNRITKK